jgi:hypothetical protein
MDARRQQGQRLDQWIETGRQFVDGVAGTRPGRRAGRSTAARLDAVGRWVGDKIDWLLDEEDDGRDLWQSGAPLPTSTPSPRSIASPSRAKQPSRAKRPLEAISRRQPAPIPPTPQSLQPAVTRDETWPDDAWPEESDFRVDRWQRPVERSQPRRAPVEPAPTSRRSLPRSSRRRD